MGTGVASSYPIGTKVQEISASEHIPYKDLLLVDKIVFNNSNSISMSSINNIIENDTKYKNEVVGNNNELKELLATNSIDVFASGYISTEWKPNTQYVVNNLVTLCGHTYRCLVNHRSNLLFKTDFDVEKWAIFIENYHLIKNQYVMNNFRNPNGNLIEFDQDFIATGTDNNIELNEKFSSLTTGSRIVVTKRIGLNWDSNISIDELNDDENNIKVREIVNFIRQVPGSSLSIIR